MGHPPLEPPVQDLAPLRAERLPLRVLRVVPAPHLFQERPLRQVEVGVEVLPQVVRKHDLHGVAEDLLQVEVDAARGPVVVHVGVHVEPGVEEHDEGLRAPAVQGQPLLGEEGVVDDPVDVDGAHRHAAHVGVAEHVIHVVRRVDAREDRLQEGEPPGVAGLGAGEGFPHQVADPVGIDGLAGGEGTGRAPPEPPDGVAQLFPDDALADHLVGQVEVHQEVVVEEVPEGAVAHVVEEARHAEQLLDQRRRRAVGEDCLE